MCVSDRAGMCMCTVCIVKEEEVSGGYDKATFYVLKRQLRTELGGSGMGHRLQVRSNWLLLLAPQMS